MPLHRRIPKRGFTNVFRVEYIEINLERVAKLAAAEIGPRELVEAGLLKSEKALVKILGRGDIAKAKTVRAHKFSASAAAKIKAAGGQALPIEG
jgi:large subunit ribosomal protein L15